MFSSRANSSSDFSISCFTVSSIASFAGEIRFLSGVNVFLSEIVLLCENWRC